MSPRAYHSPVRDRQKAQTQQRILDAVVRVVLDEGVHAFTVQNVAKRAGVAHRTVYRHYPTREALLDGLSDAIEAAPTGIDIDTALQDIDSFADAIRRTYDVFQADPDRHKALVVTALAMRHPLAARDARTRQFRDGLARRFPRLSRSELDQAAQLIRALVGSRQWFVLTEEQGMSTPAAADAIWATRALYADLERRNAEAPGQEQP